MNSPTRPIACTVVPCMLLLSLLPQLASPAQQSIPFLKDEPAPASEVSLPSVAPIAEPGEEERNMLVPEAVGAIEWLNVNFGRRLESGAIDRWMDNDDGALGVDEQRALVASRFEQARQALMAEVREASAKNENLELFVGSLYTPEQEPVLICLRDCEFFVIPVNQQYCDLRDFAPQKLAVVTRRPRLGHYRLSMALSELQIQQNESAQGGEFVLDIAFDATIDQSQIQGTQTLELLIEFHQGNNTAVCFKQLDLPQEITGNTLGVQTGVTFAEGELNPAQPVLVFVTAVRMENSAGDHFAANTTRISNSLRSVMAVTED